MFGSSLPPIVCERTHMSCLGLLVYGGAQRILCCVFVLFFLQLVCPVLPVPLDYPFFIDPSVFSDV